MWHVSSPVHYTKQHLSWGCTASLPGSEPQILGHLSLGSSCLLGSHSKGIWNPSTSSHLRTLLRKPHFNQISGHLPLTQLSPEIQNPACSPEPGQNGAVIEGITNKLTFADNCMIKLNAECSQYSSIYYWQGIQGFPYWAFYSLSTNSLATVVWNCHSIHSLGRKSGVKWIKLPATNRISISPTEWSWGTNVCACMCVDLDFSKPTLIWDS